MCHRRTFLQLALGGASLLIAGQSAQAAPKVKAKKKPKVSWSAKVYIKNGTKNHTKLLGPYSTPMEAQFAGYRWASTHGATFHGETVKKELD